jgi:hypothetical protein
MQSILNRLLLLLVVAGLAAQAQEPGGVETETRETQINAPEPGLPVPDLSAAGEAAAARQALEPSVPTAVLAQDIRRKNVGNGVMDEIELGRTEITGYQELPKVLYIVPWQKSDPGDLTGKPVNTLLDEILAPIDRSEFIRQVEYYGDLFGKDEE